MLNYDKEIKEYNEAAKLGYTVPITTIPDIFVDFLPDGIWEQGLGGLFEPQNSFLYFEVKGRKFIRFCTKEEFEQQNLPKGAL